MSKLQVFIQSSSEAGLFSVSTLIVGSKVAVLIDPPFLVPDAVAVIEWIKKTTQLPLKALFVTHGHLDHYFSANPILEAYPDAEFYAAPYVCAVIDQEPDETTTYWRSVLGEENVPERPRKPTPFKFSFFELDGNPKSPIVLLGPVQGDTADTTLFWLSEEKVVICGDAVYGRSTHTWVEEIETSTFLDPWCKTLDIIENLSVDKYFQGISIKAPKKPSVKHLYATFKYNFPHAAKNADFFLKYFVSRFGEDGGSDDLPRPPVPNTRTKVELEGFLVR